MKDDLDHLLDELLRRQIRPALRDDLRAFRQELAAGKLAADDARYIRALHARLLGGGTPKTPPADDDEAAAPDASEVENLQGALAEAKRREQALEAERDRLQGEVDSLRKEIEALKGSKS